MKKFLAILLAAMMLLATAGVAFAEDAAGFSITVKNERKNVTIAGNTYSAYMLFKANVSTDGLTVEYSVPTAEEGIVVSYTPEGSDEELTGNALLSYLNGLSTAADIRAFADYVYNTYVKGGTAPVAGSVTVATGSETATIDLESAGYYLVYGTGTATGENAGNNTITSLVALKPTTANVTIQPKLDAPTLDKQIKHNEHGTWGPVGDNQIGDDVEYRIITTVPNTDSYSKYTYKITDEMDAALTYNGDVAIYTDEAKTTALDETYYKVTPTTNGFTIEVDIIAMKADAVKNNTTAPTTLYTYYTAELGADAIVYDKGHNDNKAYLEYSNNPYQEGVGKTAEVEVYDWTFTFDVNKVDNVGAALPGAQFVLSKEANLGNLELKDGVVVDANGAPVATTKLINLIKKDTTYTVQPEGYTLEEGETATQIIDGTTNTTNKISGLDDTVTYYLYEVTAPENYNKLTAPVSFTITANYDATVKQGDTLAENSPTASLAGSNVTGTGLAANIVNNFGAQLPETGGIGTTLFYMFGGIMAAGSALMLVVRRRADAEEE